MDLYILVADPRKEWLAKAKDFLKAKGYESLCVGTGRDAQLALYREKEGKEEIKFIGAIINVAIDNFPITQVLKYIQNNASTLKVILTMEKREDLPKFGLREDILAKQNIFDLYEKDYTLDQLIEAIEGYQDYKQVVAKGPQREGASKEEEANVNDDMFTSVGIGEFISIQSVQFDLYIRLSSGRYLKILHAGDSFSQERIEKYKNEKKVEKLYFKNSDRPKFLKMNNFLTGKISGNEKISANVKMKMIKNISEKFAEEAYTQGLKPQIIEQGKALCENIYQTIHKTDDLAKLLRSYQDFDADIYSHAQLVCMFACMLVKQFEWQSKIINETVGMASLLHDIGLMKVPENIRKKDVRDMTAEELAEYQKHPEYAIEIMKMQRMVPEAVRQVVYQHHETGMGDGFPLNLKSHKILTMSKIVILCNDFVNLMTKSKLTPILTLKQFLSDTNLVKRYHSSMLENFISIFAK